MAKILRVCAIGSNLVVLTLLSHWLTPESGDGAQHAITTIVALLGAAGAAIGSAAGAAGGAIAAGAGAAAGAVGSAAGAVGGGLASAAGAVGSGLGSAVGGIGSALGIGGGAGAGGVGAGLGAAGTTGAGLGGSLGGGAGALGSLLTGTSGAGAALAPGASTGVLGSLGSAAGSLLGKTPIGQTVTGLQSGNYGQALSGLGQMLGGGQGGGMGGGGGTAAPAGPSHVSGASMAPAYARTNGSNAAATATPWLGVPPAERPTQATSSGEVAGDPMGALGPPLSSSPADEPGLLAKLILGSNASRLTPDERSAALWGGALQGVSSGLRFAAFNKPGDVRYPYTGPGFLQAAPALAEQTLEQRSSDLREKLAVANLGWRMGSDDRAIARHQANRDYDVANPLPSRAAPPRARTFQVDPEGDRPFGTYVQNDDGTAGEYIGGGKPRAASTARAPKEGLKEKAIRIRIQKKQGIASEEDAMWLDEYEASEQADASEYLKIFEKYGLGAGAASER